MDVRLSQEQLALRDAAARLVDRLGPRTVEALDDVERAEKLDAAIAAAGWRELRSASDADGPWASAVEAAIVAEELGRGLADTAFVGPTLAAELRRLADAPTATRSETVALDARLEGPAVARRRSEGRLARHRRKRMPGGARTLRRTHRLFHRAGCRRVRADDRRPHPSDGRTPRVGIRRTGARRDAHDQRRRSHPLVRARPRTELRRSGRRHAGRDRARNGVRNSAASTGCRSARSKRCSISWPTRSSQPRVRAALRCTRPGRSTRSRPNDAFAACAAAKAYCSRAALAVCETAIQVHGGIGNTWECLAHVYLRRALVSIDTFGGVGTNLDRVLAHQGIGGASGLR